MIGIQEDFEASFLEFLYEGLNVRLNLIANLADIREIFFIGANGGGWVCKRPVLSK